MATEENKKKQQEQQVNGTVGVQDAVFANDGAEAVADNESSSVVDASVVAGDTMHDGGSTGGVKGADAVSDSTDASGSTDSVRDGVGVGSRVSNKLNRRGDGRPRRQSAFNRTKRNRNKRPKSEFDTKVLSARRVSRVVAGGRRFSLSVAVVVGNGKGGVGIGTGKGSDMAAAMEKARNQAQKKLVHIQTTQEKGISCESVGKYCSSVVHIRPAKSFVAGGAVRSIAEIAGIQYISAKIQSRSKNHLNNARAAMKAFEALPGKK